jgi:chloride channel protein, CIC family
MISNLVSFFISARLQRQPIYEVLAYHDGIHLPTVESRISSQRRVIHAMRAADEVLQAEMTAQEAIEKVRASTLRAWPVSDQRGVLGMVTLATLKKAAADGLAGTKLLDLIDRREFSHLHSDHSLAVALERMGAAGVDVLPVVSRADVRKLEGVVTLLDVLKIYGLAAQIADDCAR